MPEENCQRNRLPSGIPVMPLPVALYVSNGLIFELYNGSQPTRNLVIRWERLKPTIQKEEST